MARTRPTRRSMTLVAALVALAAMVHAGPAAAAPATPLFGGILAPVPIEVNGSYVPLPTYCDGDIDVVWYGVGAAPDARWLGLNLAPPTVEFSWVAMSVSGTYRPFVGDFDGDGCEDIFWYSPGAAPDYVWYLAPDDSYATVAVSVSGNYVPVVGHFSAGPAQDIYWYAPGSGAESIWTGNVGRSFTPSIAPQVNGTYSPFVFSDSTVIWYAPGAAQDYVTYPLAGSATPSGSDQTTINGTYRPFSLGGTPVLYAPGVGTDRLVTSIDGGGPVVTVQTLPGSINGDYVVGASGTVGLGVLHVPGPGQDLLLVS